MNVVYVLDRNGQPYKSTTRNGKVRRLLKENRARVVKNRPFTIQLLYTPETDYRPKILEGFHMNIIITNDSRYPIGLAPINAEKMTLDDFMISTTSEKGIKFENAYIDIDSIDEKAYNMFNKMIEDGSSINFFRYDTKSYIKNKVTIINSQNNITYRYSELCVRLSNNIVTNNGPIAIYGSCCSGKTTLLENIKNQLKNKGVEVDFISARSLCDADMHSRNSSIINMFKNYDTEIVNRCQIIADADVNSIYKLKDEIIPSKVIIIDDIDMLFNSSINYGDIESIKFTLIKLVKYCKAIGMSFIISSQRELSFLGAELNALITNRIIVGNSNIFDTPIDIELTLGSAMYYSTSEVEKKINIFPINGVKSLI